MAVGCRFGSILGFEQAYMIVFRVELSLKLSCTRVGGGTVDFRFVDCIFEVRS